MTKLLVVLMVPFVLCSASYAGVVVELVPAEDDTVINSGEWDQLKATLTNDSEPHRLRSLALKSACKRANDETAIEIIQMVMSWATDLEFTKWPRHPRKVDAALHAKMLLTREFVREHLVDIVPLIEDQRPVLELLETLVTTTNSLYDGLQRPVFEQIVASSATLAVRREVARRILTSNHVIGGFGLYSPLFPLVDASFYPRWRAIVRDPTSGTNFRYNAAAFLSHFGDRAILDYLKQWHAEVLQESRNLAGHIGRDILMIEVQQSPEKLLEYIASTGGWLARSWAVQRAVDTGIPPARIRTAVLEHAAAMSKLDDAPKNYLSYWKRDMIKAGVLHDDDLPGVKLPKPPRRVEQ